jgi:hypothetical protein
MLTERQVGIARFCVALFALKVRDASTSTVPLDHFLEACELATGNDRDSPIKGVTQDELTGVMDALAGLAGPHPPELGEAFRKIAEAKRTAAGKVGRVPSPERKVDGEEPE